MTKKIYATGPFGELYKITLDDKFLGRCKEIQEALKSLQLKDDEQVEAYKEIPIKKKKRRHHSTHMLIKHNVLEVGVFWEEGWETITDDIDRESEELLYKSVERLPEVWFASQILWKFTTHGRTFSIRDWSKDDIDVEDIPLFEKEVQRYQKLLDEEKKK